MRLVDSFVEIIRFVRSECREIASTNPEVEDLRVKFKQLFEEAEEEAREHGFADDIIKEAKFAVVAYVDEHIMCSGWERKSEWQHQLLQRHYFDTTSAGAEFYDHLTGLTKHGPDRDVREVYLLCLGLGFKGKYFAPEDRKYHEDAKHFNLSLLLPTEANQNIDKSILFSTAYTEQQLRDHELKTRVDLMPFVIGVPIVIITGFFAMYALDLVSLLDQITSIVQ